MTARPETIIADAWRPPSVDPADLWVEQNVELGNDSDLKGRVSFDLVPQSRTVLRRLQDPRVRRSTCMVSAQSAKTKTHEFFLIWMIRNRPSEAIWYQDTKDSAKLFFKTRLWPGLQGCAVTATMMPTERSRVNMELIQLDSMNLYVFGAESKRNRERITAGTIFCDEVRRYPPGALESIENRYKTIRNPLLMLFSVAGNEGDALHRNYMAGTRTQWFWPCPKCGHKQTFRFGQVKSALYPEPREVGGFIWDTNEKTRPEKNVYNFKELAKTVRYQCENPACGCDIWEGDKFSLISKMEAIDTNPMPDPGVVSHHWWEAYMPFEGTSWPSIVERHLKAKFALKRGDIEPMKVWVQEVLGEPWQEPEGEKIEITTLDALKDDYALGESWPESPTTVKILTADYQKDHVVYVIRQWKKGGASRLIDCGKVLDFHELDEKAQEFGVPQRAVFIDVSFRPGDVVRACAEHGEVKIARGQRNWVGWCPMMGDDKDEFSVPGPDGKSIRQHWKRVNIDPGQGTLAEGKLMLPRWHWSNPHYKDRLYLYVMTGQLLDWKLPRDIPEEYLKQLTCTERMEDLDAQGQVVGHHWLEKGRHDFADCELEQLAVADIAGLIG